MKVISTITASLLIGSVTGLLGGVAVSPDGAYQDRRLQQKRYVTGIRQTNDIKSDADFSYCVGAIYVEGRDDGNDGEMIEISSIHGHPNYNNKSYVNNFAVLKLAKEVQDDIKPLKLAIPVTKIQPGMWGKVMGWGSSVAYGPFSEVLLKLDQQLMSDEDCQIRIGITAFDMTYMCAGGEANKSPCTGDAGGPLIFENPEGDGDDVLIGLVTKSMYPCGAEGYPTLYSRVSSVYDWIKTTIKA
ncbi:unnamed protein product [Peronospora farinosa]|uniref:Peptidase S1 domain-containing protein n=1 Tax=Peronospora farinosa TaxID=134698 RepID=A0AAV0TQT2_9STRA|nr:unnamed protein product [Peronospora farinosa]